MLLNGETVGYLGAVSKAGLKQFGLRSPTTIAELRLDLLGRHGDFVRRTEELSPFPAIEQDLNFIVDEAVRWADLESTVKSAGGQLLEAVRYRETYRNEKIDGPNKKRLLLSIQLRSREATLTSEQAESIRTAIVDACGKKLGAKLLG